MAYLEGNTAVDSAANDVTNSDVATTGSTVEENEEISSDSKTLTHTLW